MPLQTRLLLMTNIGTILAELKRHKLKLFKDNNTTKQDHQQITIATFFSPITPTHVTSQTRATQAGS